MTSMETTLEQVLVAAKNRHAPVTVEAAGYIALALADAVATSPAIVKEGNVRLHEDGAVALAGALRATNELAAERCVRVLLGQMLHVAVGTSPALAACARRTEGAGTAALVRELEAALVPVNRSAAKRSIARMMREASRAAAGSMPDRRQPFGIPAATPRTTAPSAPRAAPVPAPVASEPSPASPASAGNAPAVPAPAPVDEARRAAEPAPTPARDASAPADNLAASPDNVLEAATEPEYTEPIAVPPAPTEVLGEVAGPAVSGPVVCCTAGDEPIEGGDDQGGNLEEGPELLTYEPPAVEGDEAFDFGTAAPPAVGARELAHKPPEAPKTASVAKPADQPPPAPTQRPVQVVDREQHAARPEGAAADNPREPVGTSGATPAASQAPESEHVAASAGKPEALSRHDPRAAVQPAAAGSLPGEAVACAAPAACTAPQGARIDRVNELLAEFGEARERSSREVAGELKQMLGLVPTPPPPTVAISGDAGNASEAAGEPGASHLLPPVELARPRRPKLAFGLAVILLILAIMGLGAVYWTYPQLLLHQ
ncbi:MAG: hypothetical protein MUF54_18470 [Polyangiaceae bacterium]|nr:hypothetical protein [Polyangiaceae bacterium]